MYLLDSLYSSQEIPTCVKLQLAQIYGKGKERLYIVTLMLGVKWVEMIAVHLPSQTRLNFG